MKAFIDTQDKTSTVSPVAYVNTEGSHAYYFTPERDAEIVRRANKNIDLPFDFILKKK